MSNNNYQKRSNSSNQHEIEDKEKLWRKSKIDFQLKAQSFLDNKIYGVIKIIPPDAEDLIKHFELVTNDSARCQFKPDSKYILASGFDPTRRDSRVYIEAIPNNENWDILRSEDQLFFITRGNFSLTPTIKFDCPPLAGDKLKFDLIITWYHIGDRVAQKYVVRLDKKEVFYVRQPDIKDICTVRIHSFVPNEKHTIQIIARLNNDKETFQSEPIEFTVPTKESQKNIEIITGSQILNKDEQWPDSDTKSKKDKTPSSTANNQSPKPPTKQQQKNDETYVTLACGCSGPHEIFPGINHYFKINNNNSPRSSSIQHKLTSKQRPGSSQIDKPTRLVQKQITDDNDHKNEEENDDNEENKVKHDDDDDVITPTTSTNIQ